MMVRVCKEKEHSYVHHLYDSRSDKLKLLSSFADPTGTRSTITATISNTSTTTVFHSRWDLAIFLVSPSIFIPASTSFSAHALPFPSAVPLMSCIVAPHFHRDSSEQPSVNQYPRFRENSRSFFTRFHSLRHAALPFAM